MDYFCQGWIQLKELMTVPLLGQYSETEVLGEIQTSQSYRKTARYQWEVRPDGVYVRAAYGRRFERVCSLKKLYLYEIVI